MGAKSRNGEVAEKAGKGQMGGMDTPPQGPLELPYVGPHPIKQKLEKKRKDGMIRPFWSTH